MSMNSVVLKLHLVVKAVVVTLCSVSLVSCAKHQVAPVTAIAPLVAVVRGVHTVQKGETLELIAWRYARDSQDIAIANQIREPFIIRPGQVLTLRMPTKDDVQKAQVLAQKEKAAVKPVYARAVVAKQKAVQPQQAQKVKVKKEPVEKELVVVKASKQESWMWPVKGQVITRYKETPTFKGIDIANQKGTEVRASRSGKVVYSGEGLRGYGRLLIIKHDDDYLSAYAHNEALLVKEGHHVNQGQTIATMGQTDSDRIKLHFEIRHKGQPVDPYKYLPSQQG